MNSAWKDSHTADNTFPLDLSSTAALWGLPDDLLYTFGHLFLSCCLPAAHLKVTLHHSPGTLVYAHTTSCSLRGPLVAAS